jgi:hypothetical protein
VDDRALLSLIKEGATVKILLIVMPIKSIIIKNFGLNDQKCIFLILQKVLDNDYYHYYNIIFVRNNSPVYLSRAALYKVFRIA